MRKLANMSSFIISQREYIIEVSNSDSRLKTQSFNDYLLSIYCVSGSVLSRC